MGSRMGVLWGLGEKNSGYPIMLPLLLLLHILLKGLSIGEERLLMKQDLLESFAR